MKLRRGPGTYPKKTALPNMPKYGGIGVQAPLLPPPALGVELEEEAEEVEEVLRSRMSSRRSLRDGMGLAVAARAMWFSLSSMGPHTLHARTGWMT